MTGPDAAVARTRLAVRTCLADVDAGAIVLVACSGGADSLALAAASAFEGRVAALRVGAVVVDHGLQEGSADTAAQAADTVAALGLEPVDVVRVTVDLAGGLGPEASARAARSAVIDAHADRIGASVVLLGHTLDDQAETVLLGLARGSGARSLAGMPAVSGRTRRPFLSIDRGTTERACAAQGLMPWLDPHNADGRYARARLRRDALPALEDAIGPGVAQALARTAEQLAADSDALETWSERAALEAAIADGGLDCDVLAALPLAVRGRVLHRAALSAGATHASLAMTHVRALDALVVDWHGQGAVALPGGVEGKRVCGRLYLRSAGSPSS